jgi:membrane protein insertase Oxa1/YidC/SpoIIIJ
MMSMMTKQMKYVMPFMMFFIGYTLPAGVALYIFFSTGTTAIQHKMLGQDEDEEDGESDSSDNNQNENKDKNKEDNNNGEEEVLEGEVVD